MLLNLPFQDEYNQGVIDLVRKGNRDVHLAIRGGTVDMIFTRAMRNHRGQDGFEVAVIGLQNNIIRTYLWKPKIESSEDEVPAVLQPGRGIVKWLLG